jgi:hypothetical protein
MVACSQSSGGQTKHCAEYRAGDYACVQASALAACYDAVGQMDCAPGLVCAACEGIQEGGELAEDAGDTGAD